MSLSRVVSCRTQLGALKTQHSNTGETIPTPPLVHCTPKYTRNTAGEHINPSRTQPYLSRHHADEQSRIEHSIVTSSSGSEAKFWRQDWWNFCTWWLVACDPRQQRAEACDSVASRAVLAPAAARDASYHGCPALVLVSLRQEIRRVKALYSWF